MIKLIATDLDGTLLDNKKNLPADFHEVFAKMKQQGIAFAVASGRNYDGVKHIFGDLADEIYFVCDNGAFTVENGEIIDICLLSKDTIRRILDTAYEIGDVGIMMCGSKSSYIDRNNTAFVERMKSHYAPVTPVDDLYAVDDDIFKVSLFDNGDIYNHSYQPMMDRFSDELTIHVAAKVWLDTMDKSVDKGVGLRRIQEKLGITPEETMSFGDYYNDIPMFEASGHNFVMANGAEDMKATAQHIADDCNHGGVTKAILEYALLEWE